MGAVPAALGAQLDSLRCRGQGFFNQLPRGPVALAIAGLSSAGGSQQFHRLFVLDGDTVGFQQTEATFAQLVDMIIGIKTKYRSETIFYDFSCSVL